MDLQIIDEILKAILIPLLPLLALWAKTWVNEQIKSIKDRNEREYFNYHLDKVNELIHTVVSDVKSVYVDTLKKDKAFTKEKQSEALNVAKNKVIKQLTNSATDVLNKTFVDYNSWIESKIEEAVEELKPFRKEFE